MGRWMRTVATLGMGMVPSGALDFQRRGQGQTFVGDKEDGCGAIECSPPSTVEEHQSDWKKGGRADYLRQRTIRFFDPHSFVVFCGCAGGFGLNSVAGHSSTTCVGHQPPTTGPWHRTHGVH